MRVCCSLEDKLTFSHAQTTWFPELQAHGGKGKDDHNRSLPIIVLVGTKVDKRDAVTNQQVEAPETNATADRPERTESKEDSADVRDARSPSEEAMSPADQQNVDEATPKLPGAMKLWLP